MRHFEESHDGCFIIARGQAYLVAPTTTSLEVNGTEMAVLVVAQSCGRLPATEEQSGQRQSKEPTVWTHARDITVTSPIY